MNDLEWEVYVAFCRVGYDWKTFLEPAFIQKALQDDLAIDHRTVERSNGVVVNQYKLKKWVGYRRYWGNSKVPKVSKPSYCRTLKENK